MWVGEIVSAIYKVLQKPFKNHRPEPAKKLISGYKCTYIEISFMKNFSLLPESMR